MTWCPACGEDHYTVSAARACAVSLAKLEGRYAPGDDAPKGLVVVGESDPRVEFDTLDSDVTAETGHGSEVYRLWEGLRMLFGED